MSSLVNRMTLNKINVKKKYLTYAANLVYFIHVSQIVSCIIFLFYKQLQDLSLNAFLNLFLKESQENSQVQGVRYAKNPFSREQARVVN